MSLSTLCGAPATTIAIIAAAALCAYRMYLYVSAEVCIPVSMLLYSSLASHLVHKSVLLACVSAHVLRLCGSIQSCAPRIPKTSP